MPSVAMCLPALSRSVDVVRAGSARRPMLMNLGGRGLRGGSLPIIARRQYGYAVEFHLSIVIN